MEIHTPNYSGFVVIGAGLPRTGTLSTRAALNHLLDGACYHMVDVFTRKSEAQFWKRALRGDVSEKDWVDHLEGRGYRSGVDYPVSHFYKELMKVFPNAKVLLTVRNSDTWHDSVKNSIYQFNKLRETSWTVSMFYKITGASSTMEVVRDVANHVPQGFETGMFGAIDAGPAKTEQFYNQWVDEVRASVPKDRLLEFCVKEGWEPLCKFLDVPVPSIPFPRLNDTASMQKKLARLKMVSFIVVWVIPIAAAGVTYCFRGQIGALGGRIGSALWQ